MSEQTRKKRRGKLLVAFVQTKDVAIRFEIEAAKASPEVHAMFERMQKAVADVYKMNSQRSTVTRRSAPLDRTRGSHV